MSKSHPGGSGGNCVACHMPKRNAKDGGHTVFTDHRISRRPEPKQERDIPQNGELVAWRESPPALRERNLALAYVDAGFENQSPSQVHQGYRLLPEVEKEFPNDPAVLTALGRVRLAMKQPLEAAKLFERALEYGPDSAVHEGNAGMAWMRAGQMDKATYHLERAVKLDLLYLPTAELLMQAYRQQGDLDKVTALADRVRQALGSAAPHASGSRER